MLCWGVLQVPAMQNALRDGGFLNAAFDPVRCVATANSDGKVCES
jgi:hypothetical protein